MVESGAPCAESTRPFSLTWAAYRGGVPDWSVWSEAVLRDDTRPGGITTSDVLPFLVVLLTRSPESPPQMPMTSAGDLLESPQFFPSASELPAPLKRFRLRSSSLSDAVLRLRPLSPFIISPSFLCRPFLPSWNRRSNNVKLLR